MARRRAVLISEVDRRLVEKGLPPSWEEKVTESDLGISASDLRDGEGQALEGASRGDGANDRRLLENVPPHAQPRA